ncbi:MAG: cell division protein FtsL [Acidobacteriota bacterium]|nr:cell division protein FtsL [Acidobacteriota bacterium]
MNRQPLQHQNSVVKRERDLRALSRLGLQFGCALALCGGFVFAARQHFAAVHYGYESETLRVERQRLLEEQERLILEKERASSPARLEAAARQLGLKPLQPGQVGARKAGRQLPVAAALIQQSASFNR